ncbi:MAG TPA: ABC transporter permease [Candidatus Acidoferrum sp.]|nr:ABC transporter permease [Candidatus Acidoferrum sp.]
MKIRSTFFRLRNLFRKEQLDRELHDELASHLEMHIADNLRSGMTPEEARRDALLKLGGLEQTKESVRDLRGIPFLETLLQDLRYGLRMLRKNPSFTAVAVLTLALGIGANTAIFSVVNAVLLRSLPYKDSDRLVIVWEQNPSRGWTTNIVSAANFLDWRRQNTVFAALGAVDATSFNLAGADEPIEIGGERVTANLFSLLGVQPIRGQGFQLENDVPGSTPVAIVSYGLWQRRYGGDPGLVGRPITLDGQSYQVVGIMPPNFSDVYTTFLKTNAQVWISGLRLSDPGRTDHQFLALARLKPGVTLSQAQTEMDTIASRIEMQYPENKGWGVQVIPMRDQLVGYVSPVLKVLMGAVAFVLLIACVNLANLLLSRSAAREREVAIRAAMGANRARVVRQLLTESLLLSAFGGIVGLLLARWGINSLLALAPADTPGIDSVGFDTKVLGFTLLISMSTGLFFGLIPALGLSRPNLNVALKESSRGSREGSRGHRLSGLLIAAEFSLAFVLVIGAALMLKTLIRLSDFSLGFNPNHVLTMRIPLRGPQYGSQQHQAKFFEQLLLRLEALPGVQSASVASGLPIENHAGMGFVTEDNPNPAPELTPDANYLVIAPHYFRTMGIPLREGRAFTDGDTEKSQRVVIVNEALARGTWPGQDSIGKRLRTGTNDKTPWLTVVGVAANVRTEGPDAGFEPELYIPCAQYPWLLSPRLLVVRTTLAPLAVASSIRREVLTLDKNQPVSDIRTLDQVAGAPAAQRQFLMVLLGIFAGMALILAAMGIYGVLAYSVARRTHEIGIRMALGAARADVMELVLAHGLRFALFGVLAGLAGALLLTRVLASLLFGVSPTDLATFAIVTALLALVAFLACYIPARRASRVDPAISLRYE